MTFSPTFKVNRVAGNEYKDQRIPSYCDRVLWKSMPSLAFCVKQVSLRSLPEVSTSDHKPVVAEFAVKPTDSLIREVVGLARRSSRRASSSPSIRGSIVPRQPFQRAGSSTLLLKDRTLPLIRIDGLKTIGLRDSDVGGGSDPYCIFFSNPPNLFSSSHKHTPTTTVKHSLRDSMKQQPSLGKLGGSASSSTIDVK